MSLPRVALLIALAALVACGARAARPARPTGDRAVARIELVGATSLPRDELVGGLATERARRAGQPFEPAQVRDDRERLRASYVRRGWWRAQVDGAVRDDGGAVVVRFRVVEGPRARLASVAIDGLPPELDAAQVRGQIRLADGDPFDYAAYDQAKPGLIALLEREGYPHGQVDAWVEADRAAARARIHLRFTPGPRAVLGPVTVVGVEGELARAVRARLGLTPGQRYAAPALRAAEASVAELGRFASVRVEPDRTAGTAVVPVTVTVLEAPRHELRLGGGVGLDPTALQLRGRAGLSVAGFPGALGTTRAELRPALVLPRDEDTAEPRIDARLALERADLLRPRVIADVEAGYAYEVLEGYTQRGPRVRLGLRTPLGRTGASVAVGWQLRRLRFDDLEAPLVPIAATIGLDPATPFRLGAFSQAVVVDRRDDPLTPRHGLYAALRLDEGTPAAGGRFTYLAVAPELRAYLPVGPVVIAARARGAAILGDVPVTERLYAGGSSSQRGFAERRLAPTASAVVAGEVQRAPYGGAALLEAGLELRTRTWAVPSVLVPSSAAVFVDGADVTQRLATLDPTHLHWAAGAGLRWATPIGPIRIDLGVRLNRRGTDEPAPGADQVVHVSLGEAF